MAPSLVSRLSLWGGVALSSSGSVPGAVGAPCVAGGVPGGVAGVAVPGVVLGGSRVCSRVRRGGAARVAWRVRVGLRWRPGVAAGGRGGVVGLLPGGRVPLAWWGCPLALGVRVRGAGARPVFWGLGFFVRWRVRCWGAFFWSVGVCALCLGIGVRGPRSAGFARPGAVGGAGRGRAVVACCVGPGVCCFGGWFGFAVGRGVPFFVVGLVLRRFSLVVAGARWLCWVGGGPAFLSWLCLWGRAFAWWLAWVGRFFWVGLGGVAAVGCGGVAVRAPCSCVLCAFVCLSVGCGSGGGPRRWCGWSCLCVVWCVLWRVGSAWGVRRGLVFVRLAVSRVALLVGSVCRGVAVSWGAVVSWWLLSCWFLGPWRLFLLVRRLAPWGCCVPFCPGGVGGRGGWFFRLRSLVGVALVAAAWAFLGRGRSPGGAAGGLGGASSWGRRRRRASPDRLRGWPVAGRGPGGVFRGGGCARPGGGWALVFAGLAGLACGAPLVWALGGLFVGRVVGLGSLVFGGRRGCSSGFAWRLPLGGGSACFVARVAGLVLLCGLRGF